MSPTVLDKGALDKGVDQLILSDPGLKPLFDAYDVPELKIEKNYFWALCRSIIYQQISGKAASTIANRFLELFPSGKNIRAIDIIEINIDKLHSVGLSKQKASYIKNIADAFYNGEVNVENYFTGNQVCNSDQSASEALDCGEVCNKYCSSRNHKDDICNYDCNSKVCDYDGRDCF